MDVWCLREKSLNIPVLKLKEIQKVHVELTTRCNARCPMCMRNFRGYDYNAGYPLTEITLDQFKQIFSASVLKQLVSFNFNGNLGDFGLARDAIPIVRYLRQHDMSVLINTNGSMRSPDWWQQLAMPGVTINWALDGLEDTHELHRQDTDWNKVIANAQGFIAAGGRAVWKFIPFQHNLAQLDQCKLLAKSMGFAAFNVVSGGRDRGPVFSRTGEFSHWIGKPLDNATPKMFPLLQSSKTWYDPNTLQHPQDTAALDLSCIHIRSKEIYIAADCTVYPCCFLGHYPRTMRHADNDHIKELVHENNALEHGLEHAMLWFDRVAETWQQPSIAQGRLYTCINSCSNRTYISSMKSL